MANMKIDLNTKSNDQISKNWIYKDLSIISSNTSNKKMNKKLDVNAVRGSVMNILSWRPGERILNPAFGNGLNVFLYENINETTILNIDKSIRMILKSEPRIKVINIDVIPHNDQNEVQINIQYEIPKLNVVLSDSITLGE